MVAELLQRKIDVLMVGSAAPTLAAKKANPAVPIVFANVIDPVAAGLVASLGRPGGNITGTAQLVGGSGFGGKWAELLKEAAPQVTHVALLWNSANPAITPFVREAQAAAPPLKIKLEMLDVGDAAALDQALAAIGTSGAQAVIVAPDPLFTPHRSRLARFATQKRLPAIYFRKEALRGSEWVKTGG
jgi:putative ABC transport system substrate-binding protein